MIDVDWVIHDSQSRVLALGDMSAESGRYELPGAPIGALETPHEAAIRTAHEHLGLDLVPDTLLLVDAHPGRPDCGLFPYCVLVFFHQLAPDETVPLAVVDEAADATEPYVRWLTDTELDTYLPPAEARRAREAAVALADPKRRGYRFQGRPVPDSA